jgi:hypothetical protein
VPALPPAYRAIILDQQDQLQRLVRSAGIAPVRALYDRMLDDVTRRIRATAAGTFSHQQLTGLLAQIKLGLARLQAPLGEAVEGSATTVGVHAARTLLQDAAKLERHFSGAVISLPLLESARLRGLVDGQVSSLMRVHATSMARFGAQLVGRMEEEIGASISLGENQTQTIDRIMTVGQMQWYRAERLVRTEMAFSAGRSARMAADEQAEELDGDMWSRWTEHVSDEGMPLDDRVGVDSEAMHGQVAPPGEPFTQPPTNRQGDEVSDSLVGREWTSPPNRPNDRAVLVPWRSHWGVPGWRWEDGRRVPVTEEAAQRTNAAWMRSRGSTAEISSDDEEGSPPPTGIGFQSPTVEDAGDEEAADEAAPERPGQPPSGFVSPTLAPEISSGEIPEIPAGEIPEHRDLTTPARTAAADPQAIADHGWYEPAGYEADLERAERAYEEVADGLEQPVRIGVTPRHNLVVNDAADAARLNAAADLDERIPVQWHQADGVPSTSIAKAGERGLAPGVGGTPRPDVKNREVQALHRDIVSTKDLGGGVNASKVVKFRGGGAAVWKPAAGESAEDRPTGIEPGTMHVREAAAHDVARLLGIDVVPPTTVRRHEGQEGSVQAFVRARPAWSAKATERESAEQMRLLDFISGNRDRHAGNLLLKKGGAVVAIDNGQAFPSERAGIQQPTSTSVPFAGKGLLPTTEARIRDLDLDELATTLRRRGLSDEAVRHALYRATLLKEQPAVLAVPEEITVAGRPYRFDRMTKDHQERFLVEPTLTARDRISAAGRAAADAIADGGP